jgi:hypothetical protein
MQSCTFRLNFLVLQLEAPSYIHDFLFQMRKQAVKLLYHDETLPSSNFDYKSNKNTQSLSSLPPILPSVSAPHHPLLLSPFFPT